MLQIAFNAVNAKLINAPKEIKLEVQKILSYKVKGAEFSSAVGWDGRSSFFNYGTGTFPAGFVNFVNQVLVQKGYSVGLVRKPLPAPLGPENPKVDDFEDDPRYDYQPEVVKRLLKHGQIIAQVATGGGKSKIAKLAFARINRPTLFITTRGVLMYQMKEAVEKDLKLNVGVFGDSQWGYVDPEDGKRKLPLFNVALVQTLAARLKLPDVRDSESVKMRQLKLREQTLDLLEKFEFVILEEAHESSGQSYFDVMNACKNANYRLSLTATPFMKDDEEANMRLMACSGQIAIKVSEELLINRGILAKPYFKYIDLKETPESLYRSTPWQRAYKIGIVENEYRNQKIVNEISRAVKYGLPCMTLVMHKDHGIKLNDMLNAAGIKSRFIFGEHEHDERKKVLNMLRNGEINVLIGSTILDVGVDVPAVSFIALAGGGKAEVSLRQRIGRGLRSKKGGPNVAFIIDFNDALNTTLRDHAKTRKAIVASTKGFDTGIIKDGEDFDYESLGFKQLT